MRKLRKAVDKLFREESGITGLETAIILIAFVVIASVFAYSVLSAGMFSSQRGQEAIYTALEEARATLNLEGSVVATANSTTLQTLVFTVANALNGEAIDLTPPTDTADDGLADTGSTNVCVMSYTSETKRTEDLDFSITPVGGSDADNLLETGEKIEVTVDLKGVGESIGTYHQFTIEVKPPHGATLNITRTTPGALDSVMILN